MLRWEYVHFSKSFVNIHGTKTKGRIARRRGKKKAIVAVGRSILVIIWHLLSDPDVGFHDLGADHFTRTVNTETKKRNHIRQLESLGYTVTLEPAA